MENIYNIYEDYATITINGGKHDGAIIYIDLDDIDLCKKYHWSISLYGHKRDRIYVTNVKNRLLLHRLIMNTPKVMDTDHRDGNSLNNRKYNLRICTRLENARNRKLNKDNNSGHKGIMWVKYMDTHKWKAYIQIDKKFVNLGYFDKIEDAIKIRLEAE